MLRRLKATDIEGSVGFSSKEHQKKTHISLQAPLESTTKPRRRGPINCGERSKGEPNWLTRPHVDRNIKQAPRDYQNVRRTKRKRFLSEGSPLGASQWEAE